MATAALLSRHSSNPLEVPSSDARNRAYLSTYTAAKARAGIEEDSDFQSGTGMEYQSHLAQLFPNYAASVTPRPPAQTNRQTFVDLDEDMSSNEEEMEVADADQERASGAQDDDSSMEEEEEDEEEDDDDEFDEEMTIYLKSNVEQEEIREEIADLERNVPSLLPDYRIVDRLGTGTFSSVYKALDVGYHTKWDNTAWHGHHPSTSSAHYQSAIRPSGSKVIVAIKRIYVTSNPERIRNEIMIMEDCRGCRHVSQLITAFREEDQIVAIMPYHRNRYFRISPSFPHYCMP